MNLEGIQVIAVKAIWKSISESSKRFPLGQGGPCWGCPPLMSRPERDEGDFLSDPWALLRSPLPVGLSSQETRSQTLL